MRGHHRRRGLGGWGNGRRGQEHPTVLATGNLVFPDRHLRTGKIERLRELGELGHLVAGLYAGYSEEEMQAARGWSDIQARQLKRELREKNWEEFWERQ